MLRRWHCPKDWAKHPTTMLLEARASPTATTVAVVEARSRQLTSRLLTAKRNHATTADANHRMPTTTSSSPLTPQLATLSRLLLTTPNSQTTRLPSMSKPTVRRSRATSATASHAADKRTVKQLASKITQTSRRQTRNRSRATKRKLVANKKLVASRSQTTNISQITTESQTTVSVRTPNRSLKANRSHADSNSTATAVSLILQRQSLRQTCPLSSKQVLSQRF